MISSRVLVMSLLASLALACDPGAGSNATPDAATGAATGPTTTERSGDCASCHMEEYEHVRHPPHVDVKPTTCGVCHVQESWRPEVLTHEWWPLTGAHKGRPDTQCSWCHKGTSTPWVFKGTPKECVRCHQEDYDASTFPDHATFPTKCAECHSTEAWKPAKHPPKAPTPVAVPMPTTTASSKVAPKTTPLSKTPTRPTATPTTAPTPVPVPVPRPTSVPTTRPPDVVTRPSKRR